MCLLSEELGLVDDCSRVCTKGQKSLFSFTFGLEIQRCNEDSALDHVRDLKITSRDLIFKFKI